MCSATPVVQATRTNLTSGLRTWAGCPSIPACGCKNGTSCDEGDPPQDVKRNLSAWRAATTAPVPGGFVWNYEDIKHCLAGTGYTVQQYAQAVVEATSG
jgi:hypothetical protein